MSYNYDVHTKSSVYYNYYYYKNDNIVLTRKTSHENLQSFHAVNTCRIIISISAHGTITLIVVR